jgi:hypothetical protein
MTEIIATLVFDSWMDSTPECRSTSPEDRHLIYEGGGIILDLLLKTGGEGACLHVGGQVLTADSAPGELSDMTVLMEHGPRRSSTHTNALGEFGFHAIPNGTFDLCIVLGKRRFQVQGLSCSEPKMWQVVSSLAGGGD